ncbi:hypothetical protein T4A_4291 [Trichinella pseudospiralis]|uniref:Uncharacterized protein n=1 Tax=Trichinella pseudospiralis TaxID=6337 RepID=A0A0V1ELG8_TRIPS|nr:hypothetical protein T4A_4291 [Trichinella pseudospiralis]
MENNVWMTTWLSAFERFHVPCLVEMNKVLMIHGSSAVTPNLLQCADVIHCCQITSPTLIQ